jgi:hypothetical protein
MNTMIKLALQAAMGVAMFATPVAAQLSQSTQSTKSKQSTKSATPPNVPRFQLLNPALNTKIPNTVHEGGHKYLGRDPDSVVRSQIMKDEVMHKGNNY